ncbi:hypothetical protein LX36DRAFT_654598 [Colletotrichum falcatum]|nr:hypothetical protein LX36DRAFT_654598 [Colletotrichum falcatum]
METPGTHFPTVSLGTRTTAATSAVGTIPGGPGVSRDAKDALGKTLTHHGGHRLSRIIHVFEEFDRDSQGETWSTIRL